MNLFQGFLSPQPKQALDQLEVVEPYTQHKKKIKLMSHEDQDNLRDDNFPTKLILKAMNNSFTRQMSGKYDEVEIKDLFSMLTDFAHKLQIRSNKQLTDIKLQRWCIVAIDEKHLSSMEIGTLGSPMSSFMFFCNTAQTQKLNEIDIMNEQELPKTLKTYSMVLNMNNKQLVFQSHQQPSNRFYINLDTVKVDITARNPNNYCSPIVLSVENKDFPILLHLYITKHTLPFPFCVEAPLEVQQSFLKQNKQSLYITLQQAINSSRGRQFSLQKACSNSLKNQTRFYDDRFATQEQFSMYCETGDIILFRDSHTMAKVQRALTNSPYGRFSFMADHVGIVYKTQQLGICLFESNSGTGVGLASWKHLIRFHWFEGIQKIAWRKLQIHEKPHDFQERATEFVKGNLHKKFGLSLPKLLRFKSIDYRKEENRSYFCSELVATFYKQLGILEPVKSSTQYWPKDFADGNGLQILGGALDPERELIFQNSILKKTYIFYQQETS